MRRLFLASAAFASFCIPAAAQKPPSSGTTSFVFDGNRVYAELAFVRSDGTLHKTLAFVDMGSPAMILSRALFKELQLDQKKPLTFQLGELPVHVSADSVTSDDWLPYALGKDREVEALLPAGVLRKFQVVIDYRQRTLTFAQPETLKPEGIPVPFRMNGETGLTAVDAFIDGQSYPVTIDSGSAYTWLSKSIAERWLRAHPDWQRGFGAVGASNMRMADDGMEAEGTLFRIAEMSVGSLRLPSVGALAIGLDRKNWDFIAWYSRKNPGPVIGWLGGNVMKGFRLTIDYPHREMYWLRQAELDSHDLDQVGLTLKAEGGEYFVAGIATRNGKRSVEGVEPGDKLLRVDQISAKDATWGDLFSAMHGKPDESRELRLERNGKEFTVQAKVTAF